MKYFIKKLVTLIITLFIATLVTFIAFEIIPGDSAQVMLGVDATQEQVEALREELGLNEPVLKQYGLWLMNSLKGDFGMSTRFGVSVKSLVMERLPLTLELAGIAILLIVVVGIPLGVCFSNIKNRWLDRVWQLIMQVGMAVPPFFLGIIITLIFGILLQWFNPGQFESANTSFGSTVSYLLYPALAIAIPKIAMLSRFLRSSIRRQYEMDYVRSARSKGASEIRILFVHIFRNAMIPVITFLAMIMAEVLAGSVIIEQVFSLPGLGRLLVIAIQNRDYPVVQAVVLYSASMVLILNFIVDMLYQYIDPRVQVSD